MEAFRKTVAGISLCRKIVNMVKKERRNGKRAWMEVGEGVTSARKNNGRVEGIARLLTDLTR